MKRFITGCDMSKNVFDVAFFDEQNECAVYLGQFSNSTQGYEQFIEHFKQLTKYHKKSWLVCFENTGVYSKKFMLWLHEQKIPCIQEHAMNIKRSAGLKRGKTDELDALMICEYAFEKQYKLKPNKPTKIQIDNLRALLSSRDLLVKQKVQVQNSISECKDVMDVNIYEFLFDLKSKQINNLIEDIKIIEKEIEKVIESDKNISVNYHLAKSVVGIGLVTASSIIAFTENFTKITTSRQFAAYVGIAPFPHSSGKTSGKDRVSGFGNNKLKALLSNCIASAIAFDPQIKQYKERLLSKGKARGLINNNIKNKLLHRVFSVVKRQVPYVKLQYA